MPTAAIHNFLLTQSAVSDELAYRMTKALYDHLELLRASQAVTKDTRLATALTGMPVPLHPGAELYYREAGVIPGYTIDATGRRFDRTNFYLDLGAAATRPPLPDEVATTA